MRGELRKKHLAIESQLVMNHTSHLCDEMSFVNEFPGGGDHATAFSESSYLQYFDRRNFDFQAIFYPAISRIGH
jgi:hypothetical protein